jgi:hypothetical protein
MKRWTPKVSTNVRDSENWIGENPHGETKPPKFWPCEHVVLRKEGWVLLIGKGGDMEMYAPMSKSEDFCSRCGARRPTKKKGAKP